MPTAERRRRKKAAGTGTGAGKRKPARTRDKQDPAYEPPLPPLRYGKESQLSPEEVVKRTKCRCERPNFYRNQDGIPTCFSCGKSA